MKFYAFVLMLFLPLSGFSKSCLERHGALDIGSGSTKAFAAVVDTCHNKIVETLYDRQIPFAFSDAVAKSAQGEIPPETVNKAADEINLLVQAMREKKLTRISAIATSAFRSAKNGTGAASELSKRLQVSVKVLSQEEEAEVGARSARAKGGLAADDTSSAVVWDIGGGSMQMWTKAGEQTEVFKGDLASVSFKNRVISEVQGKDPKKVSSPNPLGKAYQKAVTLAAEHARKHVPDRFKKLATQARWLGIGGVLAISVRSQINPAATVFSRSDLEKALAERSQLGDSDIEGDYRSTDVSNLALVLGYMRELKIDKIEPIEASLVQGWLLR